MKKNNKKNLALAQRTKKRRREWEILMSLLEEKMDLETCSLIMEVPEKELIVLRDEFEPINRFISIDLIWNLYLYNCRRNYWYCNCSRYCSCSSDHSINSKISHEIRVVEDSLFFERRILC